MVRTLDSDQHLSETAHCSPHQPGHKGLSLPGMGRGSMMKNWDTLFSCILNSLNKPRVTEPLCLKLHCGATYHMHKFFFFPWNDDVVICPANSCFCLCQCHRCREVGRRSEETRVQLVCGLGQIFPYLFIFSKNFQTICKDRFLFRRWKSTREIKNENPKGEMASQPSEKPSGHRQLGPEK